MPGIPEGFQEAPITETYNDTILPYYYKRDESGIKVGMLVCKHHCNTIQVAHGGALMTFLDNALHLAVEHALGEPQIMPTINMSVDFVSFAREGDWIEFEANFTHNTRRIGFVGGTVMGPNGAVLRANAQYKLSSGNLKKSDLGRESV